MNFRIKKKLILRISGCKRRYFSTQEVGRKMIFPYFLRGLHDVLRNEKVIFQSSKITKNKKNGRIFSLAWNIMFIDC